MIDAIVLIIATIGFLALLHRATGFMRAESPQEQSAAQRVLAGCVIAGVLIVAAFPLVSYITNLKREVIGGKVVYYIGNSYDEALAQGKVLPEEMGAIIDKVIGLLQIVGGIAIVAGLIIGGLMFGPAKRFLR